MRRPLGTIEFWIALAQTTEESLSEVYRRWDSDIPPEVREQIRAIHAPLLDSLIAVGRLPHPRA